MYIHTYIYIRSSRYVYTIYVVGSRQVEYKWAPPPTVDDGTREEGSIDESRGKKKNGEFGVSVNDPTDQEFMREIWSHVLWILGLILLEFV
jgi:hypothetical protein